MYSFFMRIFVPTCNMTLYGCYKLYNKVCEVLGCFYCLACELSTLDSPISTFASSFFFTFFIFICLFFTFAFPTFKFLFLSVSK